MTTVEKENQDPTTTHYVRDAIGNILATYQNTKVQEFIIYGSTRLGTYTPKTDDKNKLILGYRNYELTNHLGNVLAVISDKKILLDSLFQADIVSANDYYPFGMTIESRSFQSETYRFGFNGKENDKDFGEGIQDYGARIYDSETGRWFARDPHESKYPYISPYLFANNSPIAFNDPNGENGVLTIKNQYDEQGNVTKIKITFTQHIIVAGTGLKTSLTKDKNMTIKDYLESNFTSNFKKIKENSQKAHNFEFSIDGIQYEFDYQLSVKIIQDNKTNQELTDFANANRLRGTPYINGSILPDELKEKIGYKQGDNTVHISSHYSNHTQGRMATVTQNSFNPYPPYYVNVAALFHEIFHTTGVRDIKKAEYNDYSFGHLYNDVLEYGAKPTERIYYHIEHFQNITKTWIREGRFIPGEDIENKIIKISGHTNSHIPKHPEYLYKSDGKKVTRVPNPNYTND